MSETLVRRTCSYGAFGLHVASELALPGLETEAAGRADVEIRFGMVERHPDLATLDETGREFVAVGDEAWYSIPRTGAFRIRAGREIVIAQDADADADFLGLPVLGPCLGIALHQRGTLVLHASAVSVRGRGVAFLGAHAFGKSTLAATLHTWGYPFVTDDVLALDEDCGRYRAVPSYPQMKLWPDAMSALGFEIDDYPRVHPALPKRAIGIADSFDPRPIPLERIYVLDAGDGYRTEPIPPQEALAALLGHWYGVRFGATLLDGERLPRHFLRLARLAEVVPTRRLRRPVEGPGGAYHTRQLEEVLLGDLET